MILIISQKNLERSTELVIDWLRYKHIPFVRKNGNDFIQNLDFEIGSNGFDIKEEYSSIKVYWYRRWIDRMPDFSFEGEFYNFGT
jgi:desulfoferrodoxin (superoxide reductase-like protein)